MGVEKSRRYCPEDDRMVLAEKPGTNHVLHLILTLLTVGFWVIIWVMVSLNNASNSYRCPHCGTVTKRHAPRGWKPRSARQDEWVED